MPPLPPFVVCKKAPKDNFLRGFGYFTFTFLPGPTWIAQAALRLQRTL